MNLITQGRVEARAARALGKTFKCPQCGLEKRLVYPWTVKKHCSKACDAAARRRQVGELNHNYRGGVGVSRCEFCGRDFTRDRRGRRFCSTRCFNATKKSQATGPVNRDRNHAEIVRALESLGCSVRDTAAVGGGFPDLVVGMMGRNFLVEVKNPDTTYGKSGLNEAQTVFAEQWRGHPVSVISTVQEAVSWVNQRRRSILRELLDQ